MQLWCNCHLLQVTTWIEKPNFSHHHHPETLTRGHEVHDTMKQNGNRKHHPGGFLKWSKKFGVVPIIQAGGFTVVGIQLRVLNLDAKAHHKSQCPRSHERVALPLWSSWSAQTLPALITALAVSLKFAKSWDSQHMHESLHCQHQNPEDWSCTHSLSISCQAPCATSALVFLFTKKFTLNWTVRREICAV